MNSHCTRIRFGDFPFNGKCCEITNLLGRFFLSRKFHQQLSFLELWNPRSRLRFYDMKQTRSLNHKPYALSFDGMLCIMKLCSSLSVPIHFQLFTNLQYRLLCQTDYQTHGPAISTTNRNAPKFSDTKTTHSVRAHLHCSRANARLTDEIFRRGEREWKNHRPTNRHRERSVAELRCCLTDLPKLNLTPRWWWRCRKAAAVARCVGVDGVGGGGIVTCCSARW